MDGFDLNDALRDGSSDFDDGEFEPCCVNKTAERNESQSFHLADGLDLVVTQNPLSFRRVGMLMLAANKMRKISKACGHKPSNQLCSELVDCLMDVTIVDSAANICTDSVHNHKLYRRSSSEVFSMCDASKKEFNLVNQCELRAVAVKGGCAGMVQFKMAKYSSQPSVRQSGLTVQLSIVNCPKLHLYCAMEGGAAVLKLDPHFSDDEDKIERFLFRKQTTGVNATTFESVLHPGWFISTAVKGEGAVQMCTVDSSHASRNFMVK